MAASSSSEAMRNAIRYQQDRLSGAIPPPPTEQEEAQALNQKWKEELTKFLVTVQRVVAVLKKHEEGDKTYITEAVRQATAFDVTAAGKNEVKRIQEVVFPVLQQFQKDMEAKIAKMKLTLEEQERLRNRLMAQIEELTLELNKPTQESRDTKTIERIGQQASATIAGTSVPRQKNTRI
jgi:hypothetical protein